MLTERRTVLVIDDSAEDRATYCRYLQRNSSHDYQILEATSAAMGLDLYKRSLPDAILLDYSLPDMNGLEFLALIQQTGKQQVPILMLTGQGNEMIAARSIKSGAQDYLIKGKLTADGLCRAVDYAIEQFQLQQQLKQREQQQQMISAIALQIRQSLKLQTILDTSVAGIQQALSADRVVVYQFAPDMSGQIVAEAVLPEWLASLQIQIEDTCFRENLGGDYRLGRLRAIADIHAAGLSDCHIQLLERFQVKANLVVPLLITDQHSDSQHSDSAEPHDDAALPQLWGLLVAHQCSTTRQWQAFEIELLNQVAVQMAIAIQQVEMYQQLQNELAERKRMELMLRTSEKHLRMVLDFTQIGSWNWDLLTNELTWNENHIRLLGLDPLHAETTYQNWRDRVHPEDIDRVESAVQQALTLRRRFVAEYRVCHPDGSLHWVLSKGQALYDEFGQPIRMLGVMLDITDRKDTEIMQQQLNQALETRVEERTAKLRLSEARLQEAQRIAHLGDWELDLTTHQITWSEELFRLFGLDTSQGEPAYAEHLKSFLPESRHQLERAVEQATTLGIPYELELQISRADGSAAWLFARGEAVRNAQGAIVKLLGTALDITDRKETEQAIAKYTHEVEDLYNNAPCGYHSLDGDGRFLSINETELQWLGYTRAEILGKTVADILTKASFVLFQKNYPEFKRKGWVQDVEFDLVCQDGTLFPIFLSATAVKDAEGNYLYSRSTLYDARDRKQFEASLMQYERIISSTRDGVALLDCHYTYQVANQAYLTWCNKTHDDVIGHSVRDVLGAELFDTFIQPRLDQCLAGQMVQYEKWFDYPNLVPQFLSVTYTPYLDANQTIAGIIVNVRDITDRKQAEEAIRLSEERLQLALEAAGDGLWDWNVITGDLYLSPQWLEMLGFAIGELPANVSVWEQLVHPDDQLRVMERLNAHFQDAAVLYRFDYRMQTKTGGYRWIANYGKAVVRDQHGKPLRMMGTHRDITASKQTEEQLRYLSKRLTLAVKSGAIAIWDWNVTENILTWDDRMYELYGITPDQFTNIYDAWAKSLHPDDRPFAEAAIQQALAGEKDYDPEFRVIHPDGTIRFIKAYALVERNEGGEPQQMIGINYDITDRKQAEQSLQQLTIDLQRSNQELEQFAYVASHDLQEPLRAITSYTQLLAKRYQGQIDEKADKYIYYVVDGAARMQKLIQDLLAYSRVGRYELKQQAIDFNQIVQQVRIDLQVTIAESQAVVAVAPLPTVFADPVQIVQLFQNLLGNALKYRGQATPIIKVSARLQGREWVFSIQDNGIGIEPQYAERIFEIFQRLHTRREYEGTGLGLAICKKIIERHHGRIWMESQLGQGATFFFTLPMAPPINFNLQ